MKNKEEKSNLMSTNNKYTVLMSVYYKEKADYLKMSIESMIHQTVKPDEFIIVEDGKLTSELNKVIQKYCQRYPQLFKVIKNKKNIGLGLSMRKGVEASKNELIARMDSDDISSLDRCEKELAYLTKHPDVGIVGSYGAEFIGDTKNILSVHKVPESNQDIKKFMHKRCAIIHPTVILKKSEVIRSGNYRKILLYEDYDLFSRMVFKFNVKSHNIPENLYYVRTSPDFYKRRGGIKYAETALKFKWNMHRNGYTSFYDFIISGLGQAVVCVLPNSLRKIIYLKLLR